VPLCGSGMLDPMPNTGGERPTNSRRRSVLACWRPAIQKRAANWEAWRNSRPWCSKAASSCCGWRAARLSGIGGAGSERKREVCRLMARVLPEAAGGSCAAWRDRSRRSRAWRSRAYLSRNRGRLTEHE